MQTTQGSRFTFSAYSNAVCGVVHQPAKAFLSDAPCAALPVTGGLVAHTKENLEFKIGALHIVRIARASASVLGDARTDGFVSLATSTVEKLNILDVVTADLVVSRVTSVYPPAGSGRAPSFFVAGSRFDNLRVHGKLIEFEHDPTFQDPEGFPISVTDDARRQSLFTSEHEISIPQFGTVHLGGVDIYNAKIILTMLRVELGLPARRYSDNGQHQHERQRRLEGGRERYNHCTRGRLVDQRHITLLLRRFVVDRTERLLYS